MYAVKTNDDPLFPLRESYAAAGLPLPEVEQLSADELPPPYRELLDHEDDMTSTLARFHGEAMRLRVLKRRTGGGVMLRQVVLLTADSRREVEFGAIKIHLARFPPPARMLIAQGEAPLGAILDEFQLAFVSRPAAFVRVWADEPITRALRLEKPGLALFGRCNRLCTPTKRPMAEVVEILPILEARDE